MQKHEEQKQHLEKFRDFKAVLREAGLFDSL